MKKSDNSFINVKIKLIFSNSFSDINWSVLFVSIYLFYKDRQGEISGFYLSVFNFVTLYSEAFLFAIKLCIIKKILL